jgi:hypothetical protein
MLSSNIPRSRTKKKHEGTKRWNRSTRSGERGDKKTLREKSGGDCDEKHAHEETPRR